MFPLNSNMPYIKDNGERDKLGNVIGSGGGGGGGSVTPDYENEILVVGTVDDWMYYIPMSKEYVGEGYTGYEIKTVSSSGNDASISISKIVIEDGEITDTELVDTLVYNAHNTYEDSYINAYYQNGWYVKTKKTLKDVTTDETVQSSTYWQYSTTVDYKWYIPKT